MEWLGWLKGEWFSLLQSVGIVTGFLFTAHTIRQDTKERRIQNMLTITTSHREIWSLLFNKPELARILQTDVDPAESGVTVEEELLVQFLILHLNASFKTRRNGLEFDDDGLTEDIRSFFSRPIPRFVWNRSKRFQSPDFVEFVEGCIKPRGDVKREA